MHSGQLCKNESKLGKTKASIYDKASYERTLGLILFSHSGLEVNLIGIKQNGIKLK